MRLLLLVGCVAICTAIGGSSSGEGRILEEQPCHICSVSGSKLKNDTLPSSWTSIVPRPMPDFFTHRVSPGENSMTCAEWESYAMDLANSSALCLDLRDYLQRQCCDGLPPLYECEMAVDEAILTSEYRTTRTPVVDGVFLDVGVLMDVYDVAIFDHGVDGGAVELSGALHLDWVDERLRFPPDVGCTSISVRASRDPDQTEVWVPGLALDDDEAAFPTLWNPGATVLADGRVFWSRYGSIVARCTTLDSAAKECTSNGVRDMHGNVAYVARGGTGVVVHDPLSLPEYRLDETATILSVEPDDFLGSAVQNVNIRLEFDPLENDCNVCGDAKGTKLIPDVVPYQRSWLELFPHMEGWTCEELDIFLTSKAVQDDICDLGRAYFEEWCCDDVRPTFECENSIHDLLVEETNTVTPPDPSPNENDPFVLSKDDVDVWVSLDIKHVIGIEVKSNTIEMLVALELDWYDDRLSWDPFLGDCHRASFRASLDAELTEIWVPSIELINQVEGVQKLPEAHASVRYDGRVQWRRSGTLRASCDLTGIERFPFDKTGCYLEFGSMRDPLFDRVKYSPRPVEYSRRVRDRDWNFQEYKLDIDRTAITNQTEEMSGFSNDIIRYQFYFSRASNYYLNMFVILYILFTFLSFGMFFVDYRIGERLGYGKFVYFPCMHIVPDGSCGHFAQQACKANGISNPLFRTAFLLPRIIHTVRYRGARHHHVGFHASDARIPLDLSVVLGIQSICHWRHSPIHCRSVLLFPRRPARRPGERRAECDRGELRCG